MHIIVDHSKEKYCPLCHKLWVLYEEPGKAGRVFLLCHHCMISIWVRDPMLGKWDGLEKIPCARCGKDMRLFVRGLDGFMAMKCPDKKCGCDIRTDDPDYTGRRTDMPFAPEVPVIKPPSIGDIHAK